MKAVWKGLFTAVALSALPLMSVPASAAGTVTVANATDAGSWDPIDTFTLDWGRVGSNIFDALIQRSNDLKLNPGLALSWTISDDGKRFRFKLRPNVKFQDGEPFNAAAVKFTFDRLLGPDGSKGAQQSNYTAIDHAEVVDDMTVDLILKQTDPVLITKLAGYGAMIVPPAYIKEKGVDYFRTHPVGTGPFKFIDYTPKVSLTLAANPDYWGGAPKLDKLVYRFISEAATQVAELQSGGIDVASLVPISLIDTIKSDAKLDVVSITGPTVNSLRFNVQSGVTKDPLVRKAIIEAVDRDAIIKQIMQGNAKPIASLQSQLSFGYDPGLQRTPYDPAAAKADFAKAGLKPGTPIKISIIGDDQTFREVAQAVAGYLQVVGFAPSLSPSEANTYYTDVIPNGHTGDLFAQGWGGWTFDFDNTAYLLYHSGQFWNPYIKDQKLDQMLEAQRAIMDHDKRQAILRDIAKYISDNYLELPLYNSNTVYGINKRVKGLDPAPDDRMRFQNASVE